MEPNTAVHVTAILPVPVTFEVNCIDCPDGRVPEFGETEILIVGGGLLGNG